MADKLEQMKEQFKTDDQKLIFEAIVKSEISSRADKAYTLTRSTKGKSGYSFGWIQHDIPQSQDDPEVMAIITAAVNNIDDIEFEIIVAKKKLKVDNQPVTKAILIDELKTKKQKIPCVEAFKKQINKQLTEGTIKVGNEDKKIADRIDELTVSQVQELEKYADKAVEKYGDGDLKRFAKLFVADVKNQFGTKVNKRLKQYIEGNEVTLGESAGQTVKPQNTPPTIMDLMMFHQATDYAVNQKTGYDLVRRFSNLVTSLMQGKSIDDANVRSFLKSCFKDETLTDQEVEFLLNENGLKQRFDESKHPYTGTILKNKVFNNLVAMGILKRIGNKNLTDLDAETAAFFAWYHQNLGGIENDKNLTEFLSKTEGKLQLQDLLAHYLTYAREKICDSAPFIQTLKSLGAEIKDEKKVQEFINGETEEDTPENLIKNYIIIYGPCNGYNHYPSCCCGFGGRRKITE